MFGRKFKRVFALFLSVIVFFIFLPNSVYALSTLDACAAKPSCAAAFVSSNSARSAITSAAPTFSSQSVNYNILRTSATLTGVVTIPKLLAPIFGASGDNLNVSGFTDQSLIDARIEAHRRFCEATNAPVCTNSVNLFIDPYLFGNNAGFYSFQLTGRTLVITHALGQFTNGTIQLNQDFTSVEAVDGANGVEINGILAETSSFDDLSSSQKQQAVELLSDADLIEFAQTSDVPIALLPGDTIQLDANGINDDLNIAPASYLVPGVADLPEDSSDTGDDIGGADGVGSDQASGSETESIEVPSVEIIQGQEFSAPNFLSYSLDVFSDKFPFDVFGTPTSSGSINDCPSYTFFGETFELCIISEVFGFLKYPVIISFVLRILINL